MDLTTPASTTASNLMSGNSNRDTSEPKPSSASTKGHTDKKSKQAAKKTWTKIKNLVIAGKKPKKEIYEEQGIGIQDEKEMDSFFGSDHWRKKKNIGFAADNDNTAS